MKHQLAPIKQHRTKIIKLITSAIEKDSSLVPGFDQAFDSIQHLLKWFESDRSTIGETYLALIKNLTPSDIFGSDQSWHTDHYLTLIKHLTPLNISKSDLKVIKIYLALIEHLTPSDIFCEFLSQRVVRLLPLKDHVVQVLQSDHDDCVHHNNYHDAYDGL